VGNQGDHRAKLEDDVIIRTPDQRLRVFVSSTMGELADERRAVSRAISALRLTPVMFELGARPHPPQDVYRAYLAQSDVFVGLYWQRYGWVGPDMEISGLEDELDLAGDLPRLLYVKGPAPDREPKLAAMLARIADEAADSYRHFRSAAELGRLVRDDLATLLSERFAAGPPGAPEPAPARSRPADGQGPRPLPVGTTSLVGREQAIGEVAALAGQPGVRLVTLTGPGGIGKTRLAVAVGERLRDRFSAGTVFVPLASVTDPAGVLAGVGRAAGAGMTGESVPLDGLAEMLSGGTWLLILDNLEQVVEMARDFDELLARCPGLTILATSRTVLGLRAEREYPVRPLGLPPATAGVPAAELAASPAVALFVDRARAVHPGFALTEASATAVAEICRRLEGLPLAIELAAARTRLLDPGALLDRLAASLDALGTGAADLPERQHTLRATVEWSVGLLEEAERALLETEAVFVDGWTVEAAARVASLDENRALELTEALARHSLIYLDSTDLGPRPRMLETIRAFVAERLSARPDAAEIERRHASYYCTLAQQAERPLRSTGWSEWAARLQAEAGNLGAAVRWYLVHDPGLLPHLFRALLPLWVVQNDTLEEVCSWVAQLMPALDTFEPRARIELLWTAAVAAREVGDDQTAVAARARLVPLLKTIEEPYLHAVSQLAVAWNSAIVGDTGGALEEAAASLDQLRGQDEPLWTTAALITVGSVETASGRYDDALHHLTEARDLAERFGNERLITGSQVQLGTLAVMRRQPGEARVLLGRALDLSLAIHSTRNLTLGLAAFALLAFETGDPERAALLAGAAEGLRQRAGLRAWPAQQRQPTELLSQFREALGGDRFDQVFAEGARLSQRDAAAAARG
jgi:predicted ATPase